MVGQVDHIEYLRAAEAGDLDGTNLYR